MFEKESAKAEKNSIVLFGKNSPANCLPIDFYQRNTVQVARDLLGKILVVKNRVESAWDDSEAEIVSGRIVETEAYRSNDPASHSCRGETPRCSIMFGNPGVAYVYFIYGMYEMLNFVTEPKGKPGAVLIRAVEPLWGKKLMEKRRSTTGISLTNGPGRLCQAMGIKREHKGQSLSGPSLFVWDDGYRPHSIVKSPRIGIRLATDKLWRFFIQNHPSVSPGVSRKK